MSSNTSASAGGDSMRTPDWESEGHRMYLGDCLEILPELSGVDAVVTDPPYGVNRKSSGIRKATWRKATEYESSFPDTPEYISDVVVRAINISFSLCGCVAVTPGFKCMQCYPFPDHIGGYYYGRQSTVTAWGAAWWQPVFFYGKDPKTGMLQRDMFKGKSNRKSDNNGHPCPKELTTWTHLVERMSFTWQTILDPFMGSGTTGVACVTLDRKFIGIEKEPKYFDIAVKRMEQAIRDKKSELPFMREPQPVQKELIT